MVTLIRSQLDLILDSAHELEFEIFTEFFNKSENLTDFPSAIKKVVLSMMTSLIIVGIKSAVFCLFLLLTARARVMQYGLFCSHFDHVTRN